MRVPIVQWMHCFRSQPLAASGAERARAVAGACVGLLATAFLSHLMAPQLSAWLIAPMGASAVPLFCVPASPLAQPWSVVGGNTVSAPVGVACAHVVDDASLAAPLAGALTIGTVFALRCLHPPGGAVALAAVLGYGDVLEVSRDDLPAIVDDARQIALQRHFKERTCGELMSTHIVALGPRDTLEHARALLLRHLRGVLAQEDLLRTWCRAPRRVCRTPCASA